MEPLVAPLFRGTTRLPMAFGVPLQALVLGVTPFLVFTLISWYFFGLVGLLFLLPAILVVMIMRDLSKHDNQFLTIWMLNLRERGWLSNNRHADTYSIPPQEYLGRRFIEDDL